jgi:hypothetical protein
MTVLDTLHPLQLGHIQRLLNRLLMVIVIIQHTYLARGSCSNQSVEEVTSALDHTQRLLDRLLVVTVVIQRTHT